MMKYWIFVFVLLSFVVLRTATAEERNNTVDVLEKNVPTISPMKTSAPHNNKGPSYYSKEWRNMHHRPGYKAYDQRVFNGFWFIIGLATVWSTSCYCYRRKFPKNRAMEYSRFDQYKRERYVDEIVKNTTDEKIKPKNKPKEIKFDSIAFEKETLSKSIAHLQSIIDADNPRY